jgi:TPR repeat protein
VYWAQDQQKSSQAGDGFWYPDWRITEVWQHAADLGLTEAMYAAAMMEGLGTGPALRNLRRAAALDHPPACYALGYDASLRGDRREAVAWWTKAADGGYRPAAEALTLLDLYKR